MVVGVQIEHHETAVSPLLIVEYPAHLRVEVVVAG